LVDGGTLSFSEVKTIIEEHLKGVQKKIPDLKKLERVLKKIVSECSGTEMPECPHCRYLIYYGIILLLNLSIVFCPGGKTTCHTRYI
jgi:MerR family mercuric resistance operon transcriptional regulator